MPWPDFHDAYPRSLIIFADIEGRAQARFMLLNRLAEAMQLKGAYALHSEPGQIRVAFERDVDAAKFAAGVHASKTAREGGWASNGRLGAAPMGE
jgi:hypothetical protein